MSLKLKPDQTALSAKHADVIQNIKQLQASAITEMTINCGKQAEVWFPDQPFSSVTKLVLQTAGVTTITNLQAFPAIQELIIEDAGKLATINCTKKLLKLKILTIQSADALSLQVFWHFPNVDQLHCFGKAIQANQLAEIQKMLRKMTKVSLQKAAKFEEVQKSNQLQITDLPNYEMFDQWRAKCAQFTENVTAEDWQTIAEIFAQI